MPYQEAKVYCDGSHYIAIPHTTRKTKPRITPPEEIIVVEERIKGQVNPSPRLNLKRLMKKQANPKI